MRLGLSTTLVLTVASDANGNTLADASGRSFTWNFENRLHKRVSSRKYSDDVLELSVAVPWSRWSLR